MAVQVFNKNQKEQMISAHFAVGDFWAYDGFDSIRLDTDLAVVWESFYERFGIRPRLRNKNNGTDLPYEPQPSAGYRDKKHLFGGSRTSYHVKGMAVDCEVPGIAAGALAQFAETRAAIGGIGHYYVTAEAIDKQEHIHIDLRNTSKIVRWGHQNRTGSCNIPTFGGIYALIKKGHQGYAVRKLQQALNEQGHKLAMDGAFGGGTARALKAWQKAHGLAADGQYGRKTNEVMGLFDW